MYTCSYSSVSHVSAKEMKIHVRLHPLRNGYDRLEDQFASRMKSDVRRERHIAVFIEHFDPDLIDMNLAEVILRIRPQDNRYV